MRLFRGCARLAGALLCLAGVAGGEEPVRDPTAADSLVVREAEVLTAAERSGDPELRQEVSLRLLAIADSLESEGDPRAASAALQAAGWSDVRAGDPASAREALDRAELLAGAAGDSSHTVSILNTSAIIYAMNAEYEQAIARWHRCLEISRATGDLRKQGQALGNMANAYSLAGDLLASRRLTEQAVVIDRECGNEVGLSSAHNRMASILSEMNRFDAALASSDSSIAIDVRLGRDISPALARRSQILFDAGRREEGLATLERADSAATAVGNRRLVINNRGNRAHMLVTLGRAEEAVQICRETDTSRLSPLSRVLFDGFHAMALLQIGYPEQAEEMLLGSVELFEQLRREEAETAGIALFDRAGAIYGGLGAVRLALGRPEEAWVAVESGRSASLREHLGAPAPDLPAVQAVLRQAESAALLELNEALAGETASAFLITGEDLRVVEVRVPVAEEREAAREVLTSGAGDEAVRGALSRMGAELLGPVVAALPEGTQRLYIVSSDELVGFPIEALPSSAAAGAPTLGERFAVTYLPAAWLLPELSGRVAQGTQMIVFADPAPGSGSGSGSGSGAGAATDAARRRDRGSLPEARREARAVAIRGAQVRLGPDASPAAFAAAAGEAAVLHLATHAVLDPFRPNRSGLVLAGGEPDGLVTAEDVAGRAIPADLVTLSGCRTAGGWTILGEGTLGLPRAFLAAGARSVVSSLWDVEDAAAARFMVAFYGELRAGAARDQALSRARQTLREAGYPPRDRDAFVLTGLGHAPVDILAGAPALRSPASRVLLAFVVAVLGLLGLLLALRGRRAS